MTSTLATRTHGSTSSANSSDRSSSHRPPRVLIYSHDTFGLGHLRRCMKISKALKEQYPEISILIVTGSPHAGRYEFPEGVDYVKLPVVVKPGPEDYKPRYLGIPIEDVVEIRENLILETIRAFRPDIAIFDHSRLGMKGEMIKALRWLRGQGRPCEIILGLRDIIDEPDMVIASWKAEGVYEFLDEVYDQIMIYGAKDVFDPTVAYGFGAASRSKTTFVGYIGEEAPTSQYDENNLHKQVLVTVGGGEDGVSIIETYLEFLSQNHGRLNIHTTMITGPYFPEPARALLRATAKHLDIDSYEFLTDITPHIRRADLVISMGGYNTVTEILCNARKAIIVPRTYPRKEQLIRAQRLSDMGLLNYITPEELSSDSLRRVVSSLLASDQEPLAHARQGKSLPLDGGKNLALLCRPFMQSSTKER